MHPIYLRFFTSSKSTKKKLWSIEYALKKNIFLLGNACFFRNITSYLIQCSEQLQTLCIHSSLVSFAGRTFAFWEKTASGDIIKSRLSKSPERFVIIKDSFISNCKFLTLLDQIDFVVHVLNEAMTRTMTRTRNYH